MYRRLAGLLILLCLGSVFTGCDDFGSQKGTGPAQVGQYRQESKDTVAAADGVIRGEDYSSKNEVAEYLRLYSELPPNYLTKEEAQELGWDSREGNLWEVAPGACIGGDRFGNYEKKLPEQKGRKYFECDVDYEGGYRGASRLIYSDDGLIYYTADHYETFEQLY